MNTMQITLDVPEDLLFTLNQSTEEFTAQICLWTALNLYKNHKLTLLQAAQLAKMDWHQFVTALDKHEIPVIDYSPTELEAEVQRLLT
ncbi:MAG: UPF0175 family protein [Caldilineaceae bacterium]